MVTGSLEFGILNGGLPFARQGSKPSVHKILGLVKRISISVLSPMRGPRFDVVFYAIKYVFASLKRY
jgi:hypothetical protein